MDFLAPFYLWIKAFHLIAVVCWFAVLFYLPRLFVYHTQTTDQEGIERFKTMESKLYRAIGNPSMMVAVSLGILMVAAVPSIAQGGWFHLKILLVVALIVYHVICKKHMIAFAEDKNTKTEKYFRIFNEVPAVLLVIICILVVVKPF